MTKNLTKILGIAIAIGVCVTLAGLIVFFSIFGLGASFLLRN